MKARIQLSALLLAGAVMGLMSRTAVGQAPEAAMGSADQSAEGRVEARLVDEPSRRVVKMSNGFTIILQQNKTAPVVAARIYIRAGALTEQQHMAAGISHVVEHLVAGASSGKRKESENTLLLQQIGNDSNAYTEADSTVYFITTTADKWATAMDLLVDFTTNSDFTREQFDREFKVVQREIEMDEEETDRIFYQQTQENRYIQSPARHPVVGYKTAFQKITFEDCKAYFQEMYVPDNMVISVAGDLDLASAEKQIVEMLKDVKRKRVPAIALPSEPAVVATRYSAMHDEKGVIKQARINWAFPTVSLYDPDLYAADMLASVLGGSESSVLVRKLRDELGLVSEISASDPTPWYVPGEIDITAQVTPEKIPAAQKAVFEALDEVAKNGVPAAAIERAKAQAVADRVYGDQTAEQQAVRNALDYMSTGSVDFSSQYVDRIQKVTGEQIKAAAQKYLNRERLLTSLLLPKGAKDPLAGTESVQHASMETVAVKKTVLKNGVTLLISRNAAAPLAAFNLYVAGGLLAESEENNGIGATMMDLMIRGTDSRTHEQIANYLDGTGTTVAATSGNNSFQLSMACMKDKAPEAFGLFADLALHPNFDKGELEQIRDPRVAAVEAATEDWTGESEKAIREIYYAKSPYQLLPVGKAEVIKKLTPEAIKGHYQNYFLDPQKMVIAISGDIDEAAAAKWAAPFEAIPQHAPMLATTSTPAATPLKTVMKKTDRDSATVMLAYPPGMKVTSPDRFAMILVQTYLGGYSSPSGSVLHETLRGKGLVYIVQASNVAGSAGGMFLISALGEPKNAVAIANNIEEIVGELKAGKISDEQLALAKDQAITGEKLSQLTIADKSSGQALDELLGLGYDEEEKFAARIKAVTKEEFLRAANKYLTVPTVVILSPEGK